MRGEEATKIYLGRSFGRFMVVLVKGFSIERERSREEKKSVKKMDDLFYFRCEQQLFYENFETVRFTLSLTRRLGWQRRERKRSAKTIKVLEGSESKSVAVSLRAACTFLACARVKRP